MMDKEVKKELQMFAELCSKKDYDIITGKEISFDDFNRVSYILNKLGLVNLSINFHLKHYDNYESIIEGLDDVAQRYGECEYMKTYYADMCEEWINEFVSNIKDEKTKERVLDKMK